MQSGEVKVFEVEMDTQPLNSALRFKLSIEQTPMGSGPILNISYSKRLIHDLTVGVDYTYLPTGGLVMLSGTGRLEWSMMNRAIASRHRRRVTRIKNRIREIKRYRDLLPEESATLNQFLFEPRSVLTAVVQSQNIELSYVYQVTEKFALATALTFAKGMQQNQGFESSLKLGYAFESDFVSAKGQVTDLTTLDSLLEQKISDRLGIVLSSHADLSKDFYTFGLGINYVLD